MLVRTQILIFGLIGNIIIAGILLYMNVQNQNIQEKSSNNQYTSIVESAWVQSIDNSFANMNSWGPNGEKGEQYWNPYIEIGLFTEIGIEGFDYSNALIEEDVNALLKEYPRTDLINDKNGILINVLQKNSSIDMNEENPIFIIDPYGRAVMYFEPSTDKVEYKKILKDLKVLI